MAAVSHKLILELIRKNDIYFFPLFGVWDPFIDNTIIKGAFIIQVDPPAKVAPGGSLEISIPKRGWSSKKSLEKGGLQKFQCVCQGIKNKYVYMHIHYIMMF